MHLAENDKDCQRYATVSSAVQFLRGARDAGLAEPILAEYTSTLSLPILCNMLIRSQTGGDVDLLYRRSLILEPRQQS